MFCLGSGALLPASQPGGSGDKSQASQCGICGGQGGTVGHVFRRASRFSSVPIIPPMTVIRISFTSTDAVQTCHLTMS
jgi:hypothetical protein